jgi:hypothetical protein
MEIYPHPLPLLPEREKGKYKKNGDYAPKRGIISEITCFFFLPSPFQGEGPGMRVNSATLDLTYTY